MSIAALAVLFCLPLWGAERAAATVQETASARSTIGVTDAETPTAAQAAASAQRCASAWKEAGFSSSTAITATAVGMGESHCTSSATNSNGATGGCPRGSIDRGMWQINSCYHSEVSESCAFDAVCNAKAAYRISSSGTNWRAWAAYRSGAYRRHLSDAQAAVDAVYGR